MWLNAGQADALALQLQRLFIFVNGEHPRGKDAPLNGEQHPEDLEAFELVSTGSGCGYVNTVTWQIGPVAKSRCLDGSAQDLQNSNLTPVC